MESIEELKKICQKPNYKKPGYGNWYVRHIIRDLALYVTRPLLKTSITANQVTFISILVGVAAAFFFMIPSSFGLIMGTLLLQFWYLLDHVDGQIARYKKTSSITGVFFDYITHYLVHSIAFIGLGIGAYLSQGIVLMLVLGSISALFMAFVSMFYDAKWKAFFHYITFNHLGSVEFLTTESGVRSPESVNISLPKKIFMFVCKLTEIHVILNILTLLAVVSIFSYSFFGWSISELFIVIYSFMLPLVFIARCFYAVKNQQLDSEFKEKVNVTHV